MADALRIAGDSDRAMPRKFNFTVAALAAVKCPPGKDRVWVYDTKAPGLAYMVTAADSRSYYWYRKIDGRPVRHRLGDATLSIDQARKLALAVMAKVAAGGDPHAERKQIRGAMTFGELWTRYLEQHAKPRKRSWPKDEERYNKHLKLWAARSANKITIDDATALHSRIGKTHPGAANRVLALLSAMYTKTRMTCPNPARGVQRFPERSRDTVLLPDERRRFFEALENTPQPWADFFEVCLLTGQRSGNVKSMRWDEVKLADATWIIPGEKFKTGQPMSVPLVDRVIEILDSRKGNGSEWVFPATGHRKGPGHITEPKGPWADLCKRAGLSGIWIHDLRGTNATVMAELGVNQAIIQKSLGHRNQQTTGKYVRLAMDPVRASVAAAADAMRGMAKPKQ